MNSFILSKYRNIKNYADKITRKEILKAFIECFIAVEKVSKEELKKEVDALLV